MIITEIWNYSDLLKKRNEWNNLLKNSNTKNIFLTWEWIFCWWINFNERKELYIITIFENDTLIGIAPFYTQKILPILPYKLVMICGASDLASDHLDIISRRGKEEIVSNQIIKELQSDGLKWLICSFSNLVEESILLKKFKNDYDIDKTIIREISRCPYIHIDQEYEEYINCRFNRKKRYNLRREERILVEKKGLRINKIVNPKDVDQSVNNLFELHEKRAKHKKIDSTFSNERKKLFFKEFTKHSLKQKWLEFYFLTDDKVDVAAMYCLDYDNKFYFYQSGLNPQWEKFSVGSVLQNIVIRDCFKRNKREFDFLQGDEKYKKKWTDSYRTQYSLTVIKSKLLSAILKKAHKTKFILKKGEGKIEMLLTKET